MLSRLAIHPAPAIRRRNNASCSIQSTCSFIFAISTLPVSPQYRQRLLRYRSPLLACSRSRSSTRRRNSPRAQIDIFREKLPVSPFSDYYPDYRGVNDDYDAASTFLLEKFTACNQNLDKSVYAHFTCATDTKQLAFVLSAVNDVIIQNNLRDCKSKDDFVR